MKLPLMLLVAGSLLASTLLAQEVKTSESSLLTALNARARLAGSILTDDHKEALKAVMELQNLSNPSGLSIDANADFGFAAIDVGRRLVVMHKQVAAEAFFQAAETSLSAVINRTPDSSPKDKVQYLEARALIRVEFLNKLAEGRSDFDAALKLSPGNQRLQQMSRQLSADPATMLQNHKELPAKG